jgi:hypothetical protein
MKNLSISKAKNCLIFSVFFSFSMTSFSQKVEQKLFDNVSIQESPFDVRTHSEHEVRAPKPVNSSVVDFDSLYIQWYHSEYSM